MAAAVNYQVIFTGKLRNGYAPEVVKAALSRQLKLPLEKVEKLFAKGNTVLKQTPSQEQAQRIANVIIAAGAEATVKSSVDAPLPDTAELAASDTSLPRPIAKYSPFASGGVFKPLLFLVTTIEGGLALLYAGLLLTVFGWVISPLFSSPGEQFLGAPLLGLVLQLTASLVGLFVLFILVKPLLALREGHDRGIVVSASQEPDLHAFIEGVCERIGALAPSEIRFINEAAVRTGPYGGIKGFFTNQSVLMIGVPLIAGLNSSQLAALVAQSLNHYRGPMAPRASTLLLALNQWLQRAARGDDMLEANIQRWYEEDRIGDTLFSVLNKICGFANRLVGWRMRFSRIIGQRLLHTIVNEGDKTALTFTNAEGFDRLLAQIRLLAFAREQILPGLSAQWEQKGQLPDNLVQMMVLRSRKYPEAITRKLRLKQQQDIAACGDFIPSDMQRLRSIADESVEEVNLPHAPSVKLFRNYPKLVHTLTLRFYHHQLQLPISPYHLKKITPKGSPEQQIQQRLDLFFHQIYTDFLPLGLQQGVSGLNGAAEAKKQWQMAMAQIRKESEQAKKARQTFVESESAMIDSTTLEQMHLAGLGIEWDQVKLSSKDLEAVHQRARDDEAEYTLASMKLQPYLKPYAMRLAASLAILGMQQNLPAPLAERRQEAQQLLGLLERLDKVQVQLQELQLHTTLLETLLSFDKNRRQQKLVDRIEEQAADCKQRSTTIEVALKRTPNPFANGKAQRLMSYLLQDALEEGTPLGDFDRGNDIVKRLALVQRRAVAQLVATGEQVEKLFKLA